MFSYMFKKDVCEIVGFCHFYIFVYVKNYIEQLTFRLNFRNEFCRRIWKFKDLIRKNIGPRIRSLKINQ